MGRRRWRENSVGRVAAAGEQEKGKWWQGGFGGVRGAAAGQQDEVSMKVGLAAAVFFGRMATA
ncbi:hypothetical protein ACJRO7_029409, partial [Eucalyptus globulus]